jgi:hypothetical protein
MIWVVPTVRETQVKPERQQADRPQALGSCEGQKVAWTGRTQLPPGPQTVPAGQQEVPQRLPLAQKAGTGRAWTQ